MLTMHGHVQQVGTGKIRLHRIRYQPLILPQSVRPKDAMAFAYGASLGTVDAEGTIPDSLPALSD